MDFVKTFAQTSRATFVQMGRRTLAAQRYAGLIEQLGEELDWEYGWKSEVARRLGMDPSLTEKIRNGDRNAGPRLVERAMTKMRLKPEFFYAEGEPVLDYRKFIKTGPLPFQAGMNPVLVEFLESPLGDDVTKDEANELAQLPLRKPTVKTYHFMLLGIRAQES